ncbi:MAG: sigma-70 family RNA polymerase sigma factor [Chitinophagales bacterium]|nr:sigma-70 family RNA polymerase sigma factor [Chitinophagales bacterium]MDW8418216.1 sigma-70 family RNA polymerase sigma factor [Chitinophagales bacterium]
MVNLTLSMADTHNDSLSEIIRRERKRLLEFIRKRVPTQEDAEDVLQDVFYELVNTYRLMKPVEQIASWLFTVARNKITDRYRKKKPDSLEDHFALRSGEEGDRLDISDFLPARTNSPETELMREAIQLALMKALDELPEEQRQVFIMHELEDKSFKEIEEITGANINTLLSRKRYAVLYLREKLQQFYDELGI